MRETTGYGAVTTTPTRAVPSGPRVLLIDAPPAKRTRWQGAAVAARDEAADWLRGLVMVLMVLDHARDVWQGFHVRPLDLTTTTPVLYATRWVTHVCAPVFVFLAGAAAHLYGARHTAAERTRFLLSRGAFLVVLEVTVIRLLWAPDPLYHFTLLQVIWVIGWSMIALAALSRAPRAVIVGVGAALVLGHDALDGVHAARFGALAPLWNLLHEKALLEPFPGRRVYVSYPLIPWVGVMALGYAFGPVVAQPAAERRAPCLRAGVALTVGFVLLRALNGYGDPNPWLAQRTSLYTVMAFLNCEKYPPSLCYLMMTLGPALVLFAVAPALLARLRSLRALIVFGKVPLLFYVLHLLLLRCASLPVAVARFGGLALAPRPAGTNGSPQLPLYVAYIAWIVTLVALYPVCRAYARLKATRKRPWMSYL